MRRINTAVWMSKYKRWQIKVQKDNIRKTFYSSIPGREGQREANTKADAWLDMNIINTKKKVRQTAEEYLEQIKITTSKSHWKQYECYFKNWINPKIGNVRIENVNEQHLQSIINDAFSKKLAKKTLNNIRSCLQSWLKFCRKSKYTTLFIEGLTIPKTALIKEKRILQPEEIIILFNNDNTFLKRKSIYDLYVNAYRFQLLTGLRPGELIGLKKTDIKNETVFLKRSINVDGETTNGKNDNARRTFNLTPSAMSVLEEQNKVLIKNKIESEYIFPTKHGEPILERTYYVRWKKYREHNGIKTPVTPYELRHTFVSIVKTLPEGYLRQIVGHSKNMDTYGVYSHNFINDRENAANMIQNIFENLTENKSKE